MTKVHARLPSTHPMCHVVVVVWCNAGLGRMVLHVVQCGVARCKVLLVRKRYVGCGVVLMQCECVVLCLVPGAVCGRVHGKCLVRGVGLCGRRNNSTLMRNCNVVQMRLKFELQAFILLKVSEVETFLCFFFICLFFLVALFKVDVAGGKDGGKEDYKIGESGVEALCCGRSSILCTQCQHVHQATTKVFCFPWIACFDPTGQLEAPCWCPQCNLS